MANNDFDETAKRFQDQISDLRLEMQWIKGRLNKIDSPTRVKCDAYESTRVLLEASCPRCKCDLIFKKSTI